MWMPKYSAHAIASLVFGLVACGSNAQDNLDPGNSTIDSGTKRDSGSKTVDSGVKGTDGSVGNKDGAVNPTADGSMTTGCASGCPSGYTCGSANGISVCRSGAGIPLFSHVFVIMMENTSLSSLQNAMTGNSAPNLAALAAKGGTATDYHGVSHPSLPNYIALTSGSDQSIACDCSPTGGTCSYLNCQLGGGNCGCGGSFPSIADQLETATKGWMAFGEGMGTACNGTSSGGYAVRHIPFLYYTGITGDATRCANHIVDFTNFNPDTAPDFSFIAPNLTHDMHDPFPATAKNVTNGDTWIGPQVDTIMASASYKNGGLIVVVWDEDDLSGLIAKDDPVPIFVLSPYATVGYSSTVHADHYSLLATFEDGLNLPRLGSAAQATPLTDYFPSN